MTSRIETAPETTICSGRAIIFNRSGQVPIVQRHNTAHNNPGKWELVGGTIDEPDIASGIQREALEEIGVGINVVSPIYGIYERPLNRGMNGKYLAVCALAETIEAYPEVKLQKEEATAYEWATLDEILNHEEMTNTIRLAILKLGEHAIDMYFPNRFGVSELIQEYMSDLPEFSHTDN